MAQNTESGAKMVGIIKARARSEGIALTPDGRPIFQRDAPRFAEIVREVRSAPRPRTPAEILEDEMSPIGHAD